MSQRKLIITFGANGSDLGAIAAKSEPTWEEFAEFLTKRPPETNDKASRGWFCPAEFTNRRHSDDFIARHALTLDYDVVTPAQVNQVLASLKDFTYAAYTTGSHTVEKPRVRVVMPTSRPMSADEFCAVSRYIAALADIELAARESHVAAQMSFQPTVKPGAPFKGRVNTGKWIDVDEVLATYLNWRDRTSWPKRKEHDEQYSTDELPDPPTSKPGVIGAFCRAFDIPTAIERFDLPYTKTSNPNRYTYTAGSRPEGAVLYDGGLKLHSHHDSDPAHGQHNAYDLVRLHRFGTGDPTSGVPLADLPSTKAMAEFVRSLPEIAQELAENDFEILPESVGIELPVQRRRFQIIPATEFAVGSPLAWIIKSVLPRAELGVIYGESGAGKSFLALDLCTAISRGVEWNGLKVAPGRVIYVCAEGAGGFRNRLNAYARKHDVPLTTLPGVVADAPNLLEVEHVLDLTREIVAQGKADLIIIDTLAATTPGGNENSGEDMGKVISHCKSMHKATGAMVVLIHHSGKDAAKGARGWSGIKAAMDFEMEVTRNGDYRLATLTKLKDGEDQKSWHFKLNQVILGLDEDGEDIASCTVDFIDPPEGAGKRAPTGIREKAMFELAKQMLLDGTCIVTDLLDRAVKLMPVDNSGKDSRRAACKRGLEKLLEHGHLYLHDGESLTTSSAVQATEEDFDKKATA